MLRIVLFSALTQIILSGCGNGIKIQQNESLSEDLLRAPHMDLESTAPPVFHPIFTQENYEAVLQMNDLSYAAVNAFGYSQHQAYPTEENIGTIRSRLETIPQSLSRLGWNSFTPIYGRTGRDNVDPDLTAIVHTHHEQRLIVVTFHGSRIGDRNPRNHDGHGDWGSNYDSAPVTPNSVGILEIPDSVRIHRGFGNNLASARSSLLETVRTQIEELGANGPIWLWTTGHSKGGGMAGLAAALLKSHFLGQGERFSHVKVGGILFSSPRVVQGDGSQNWFHQTLGRSNIFRINVHGDPVTISPSRAQEGYRSLGVLFLDSIWAVNLRTRQTYGSRLLGWLNTNDWANYHYGCNLRGIGYEFDPSIILRYSELEGGFEEGRRHLKTRSSSH